MSEAPHGSAGEAPGSAGLAPVIGPGAAFDGLLTFRGAARIEGALSGKVLGEGSLFIGPEARVQAHVEVDELVIAGSLEGSAHSRERLRLLPSARVDGDLRSPCLLVEEGCEIRGRCNTRAEDP